MEPRFALGDTVWCLINNKPVKRYVCGVIRCGGNVGSYEYIIRDSASYYNRDTYKIPWIEENRLFTSKDELLDFITEQLAKIE